MRMHENEINLMNCCCEQDAPNGCHLNANLRMEINRYLKDCAISKSQQIKHQNCAPDQSPNQHQNAWERETMLRNLDMLSILACPPPPPPALPPPPPPSSLACHQPITDMPLVCPPPPPPLLPPLPPLPPRAALSSSSAPAPAAAAAAPESSRTSRTSRSSSISSRNARSPVRLKGHPVTILTIDERHQLKLHEAALKRVLLNPQYRDCPISIVAVAGTFRKGKSFLLDYFLRYLGAGGHSYWMGMEEEPLRGFSWRGGAERDTDGVVLWSNPFLLRKRASVDGEADSQVALFLMDTQGTFDQTSTMKDCTTLFALTTMVSSVVIYNLMHNIQRDDLQHLQYFTEYAKMALLDTDRSPFQDLVFLVRDWSYPYEKPYGFDGGEMLLKRRLEASDDGELVDLRYDLFQAFENVRCYLMPHPGLEVSTKEDYDGRLSGMDPAFRVHLREFIEATMKPVVKKKICGHQIKCFELFEYFKEYTRVMQSNVLPEPKTLYVATAEANHLAALADASYAFSECVERQAGVAQPYVPVHRLRALHALCRERALALFDERKKMGTAAMTMVFRTKLSERMDAELVTYEDRNRAKRVFGTLRTPLALFGRKGLRKMKKVPGGQCSPSLRLPDLVTPRAVEVCATNSDTMQAPHSIHRETKYRVGADYHKMTHEERRCAGRLFWKRTPVVIPAVATVFFFVYLMLTLVKLRFLATVPKFLCLFFLVLFLCWVAAWYTGYGRRSRNAIDNIVDRAVFRVFAM